MAKAEPLTMHTLKTAQITPNAATPARRPAVQDSASNQQAKPDQVPLQIRIPRQDARAIKVAAAERDISISDFMLSCFHAFMKNG